MVGLGTAAAQRIIDFTEGPASGALAAQLSSDETAIVTTFFALVAVLLTVVILRTRDRRLAKQAPIVPQREGSTVTYQPTSQGGMAIGAPPLVIPGYCPNCGMATKPMARFCDRCGRRLA